MSNRCDCGEQNPSEFHNVVCPAASPDTSGFCSMCGGSYTSYTKHIFKDCDGGEG